MKCWTRTARRDRLKAERSPSSFVGAAGRRRCVVLSQETTFPSQSTAAVIRRTPRCARLDGRGGRPDIFASKMAGGIASGESGAGLLWLQVVCQLFADSLLLCGRSSPSIQSESRPAGLVMTVTDF